MPADLMTSAREAVGNNAMARARHSMKLFCSDRLSAACDKVPRLGSHWINVITKLFNEMPCFFRDFFAPIIWQGIDLINDSLNSALSWIEIIRQQAMDWIQTNCGDRICPARDVTHLMTLTANNLVKSFATNHPYIHRTVLTTGVIIILFVFKKFRRVGKPKSKRNLRRRQRSYETQLALLHWEDDNDDNDYTSFATKHSKTTNSLDEDPSTSNDFERNRNHRLRSNAIRLPPLRGPATTTLTFRAYAPPAINKEIPKVDLVGAFQFVKTGNVRTFVHVGARRLLVLNFHDMTLEVYLPKQLNEAFGKQINEQGRNNATHEGKKKKEKRRSGIHIMSKRNLLDTNEVAHEDSDDDEVDEEWSPNNFEPRPAVVIMLCQLVSISALPPRQSSALEISYRIPTTTMKKMSPYARKSPEKEFNTTSRELDAPNAEDETIDSQNNPPCLDQEASAEIFRKPEISPRDIETTLNCIDSVEFGADGVKNVTTVIQRRDEFVLLSPHDAAEFQRMVMALRTSGRDISQLYEMLEEAHANTEAHFPQMLRSSSANQGSQKAKGVDGKGRCHEAPIFHPPGVALDDAWRCMNEIPGLREGLIQYHQHSYKKFGSKYSDMIAAAAASGATNENRKEEGTCSENELELDDDAKFRKQIAHFYATKRSLLGIVDFVFLFINPLPLDATPYATPCASSAEILNRDVDSDIISGIDMHHQRLQGLLQLQRLVRKTSLYVIAYCDAKLVVRDGWHLRYDTKSSPGKSLANSNGRSGIQDQSIPQNEVLHSVTCPTQANLKRLAFDNDRDNWSHDVQVRNECYEASVGKDVSVIMHGKNSRYQGFALVGLHSFRLPYANSSQEFWLDPKLDPVDCLPSLRGVIEKYPDRQFLVVSNFNEYSSIAVCLLFVRSFPVDVDPAFDHTLRTLFGNNIANEPNQRLQLSLQIAFAQGWSSLKKMLVRTILSIIFTWFSKEPTVSLNIGTRERLSCPPFLVRNFATVRYFGGIREESHPKNYVSITVQLNSGRVKSWIMRYLFTHRKYTRNQGLIYDVSYALDDDTCERVLATVRMVHMDAHSAMPSDYEETGNTLATTSTPGALLKSMQAIICDPPNDELYSNEIDAIFDILDGVVVPRKLLSSDGGIVVQNELVRLNLSRSDIERYLISCACDIQAAAVRIVESCSWRGLMFPINVKSCRIELCSGQCFQQGRDKENNPVFYFRHMLKGPWLNDADAAILAVLHRLETYFQRMALLKPGVKITAIILMGTGLEKHRVIIEPTKDQDHSTANYGSVSNAALFADCDPMIDPNQEYTAHGSVEMFSRLIGVLRRHYPERLQRALVIPGGSWTKSKIREYLLIQRILTPRVIILSSLQEITNYVHDDELVKFAGGKAAVACDAFKVHS